MKGKGGVGGFWGGGEVKQQSEEKEVVLTITNINYIRTWIYIE